MGVVILSVPVRRRRGGLYRVGGALPLSPPLVLGTSYVHIGQEKINRLSSNHHMISAYYVFFGVSALPVQRT